eukprot:3436903-Karenia_brevis.AAC.1
MVSSIAARTRVYWDQPVIIEDALMLLWKSTDNITCDQFSADSLCSAFWQTKPFAIQIKDAAMGKDFLCKSTGNSSSCKFLQKGLEKKDAYLKAVDVARSAGQRIQKACYRFIVDQLIEDC